MAALGDCHRLFLQAMMGKSVAKAVEAKDLYKRAAQACGEHYDEANFTGFIASINRRLKPLDLKIESSQMEDSATVWYGLVNQSEDPAAAMATTYTPAELAFFNKILELVVLSEDGLASSTDILHVVSSLERKISYKDAQAFLKVLADDKWLDEVVPGVYGPGPRFILELRPHLSEMFEGDIVNCHLCKNPVIRGQLCGIEGCAVKLHHFCVARLAGGRGTCTCPGCQSSWPHDIPEIDLQDMEVSSSSTQGGEASAPSGKARRKGGKKTGQGRTGV